MYTYKYPHPAVTTDCVIFGFDGTSINILLIERGIEPYKGTWALPGGFLNMDETVEEGAKRELYEETTLRRSIWNNSMYSVQLTETLVSVCSRLLSLPLSARTSLR